MKSKILLIFPIVVSSLLLNSCSVFMAAKKSGVSIDQLSECKTRECMLTKGAIPVSHKTNKKGRIIEEVYRVKKPTGSAARATMHGVLDVATLGIWEVAGTPIEGSMDKNKMYAIKVLYKNDGESIKTVELVQ